MLATIIRNPLSSSLAAALVLASAATLVQTNRLHGAQLQIARMQRDTASGERDSANLRANQAEQAIGDIAAAASRMRAHGDAYAASESTLGAKLEQIIGALKNAKPLPADCRPDAVRVQQLREAVDATNAAAFGSAPSAGKPPR